MGISYIEDMQKWVEEFTFSVPVSVWFSETDMYGHLNNTVPFKYFEHARIEYLKHVGQMDDWTDPKGQTIPVVADLQCDFLKQVYFDEHLDLYVKANSIGKSSVDLHYMAKNRKNEVVFTGRGTIVQIDRKTGKSFAWSEEQKSAFLHKVMN
ncbi:MULTISPECIES: thioesterase family protein [Sporosarcina]|uniref:Acyl-CoA thioesterase n=1 Tax=Sporosarcina contaminans TaxID=633403 RepID=A0ABW3U1P9_9BACL